MGYVTALNFTAGLESFNKELNSHASGEDSGVSDKKKSSDKDDEETESNGKNLLAAAGGIVVVPPGANGKEANGAKDIENIEKDAGPPETAALLSQNTEMQLGCET